MIRSKGRSVLIFFLILLIAVSSCIALSIRNSAETAKEATYDTLKVTGQITIDRQKIMSNGEFDKSSLSQTMSQFLSLEELEQFAESKYVSDYNYTQTIGLNGPEELEL